MKTLAPIAEAWRTSRLDVSDGAAATHRVNLGRIATLSDRAELDHARMLESPAVRVGTH